MLEMSALKSHLKKKIILKISKDWKSGQCKMQTADCRLQTRGKMQTESKMQTKDCTPVKGQIKRPLIAAFKSPLMKAPDRSVETFVYEL